MVTEGTYQDQLVVYGGYIDDGTTVDGFATLELSAEYRIGWDHHGHPFMSSHPVIVATTTP